MARKRYHNPKGAGGPGEFPDALPVAPAGGVRGRGAQLNPGNRFETTRLHVLGEHLDALPVDAGSSGPCQVPTEIFPDRSNTVINRVESPDVGFEWSLNPYRGCEHGCIYCYARTFHEMLGFSCGLDFETKIMVKFDAPDLLRRELARPSWPAEPIAVTTATDAYQPLEARLGVTRRCLEVMAQCHQPVTITTKSKLVLRDLDLLSDLARFQAVRVAMSLTTLDHGLAAKMEPRASSPGDRLKAVEGLSRAGVPVLVLVSPIVPGLTDQEVPAILRAAANAGAKSAAYDLVRLPGQVQAIFLEWIQRQFPDGAQRIEQAIRQVHNGKLDNPAFFARFRGYGALSQQIARMFKVFARRFGLDGRMPPLSGAHFHPPQTNGQLPLFDRPQMAEPK